MLSGAVIVNAVVDADKVKPVPLNVMDATVENDAGKSSVWLVVVSFSYPLNITNSFL